MGLENQETYYHRVNPHLVAALEGLTDERVLEIGCAAGDLGACIKEDSSVHWTGVEIVPQAAKKAAAKLNEVHVAHIENDEIPLSPHSYDLLVLGDVLEHLQDPWATLKKLTQWLRPSARVICSLPNMNHWSIFAELLSGHFRYRDDGILDRTHLRFFTLRESLALLEGANLHVERVESIEVEDPNMNRVVSQLSSLRNILAIDNKEFEREARTYQWLFHARWQG